MKREYFMVWGVLLLLSTNNSLAQVNLNADGEGSTYELINSVLAPDGDVVEAPDCSHESFGRHIDEVFDQDLNAYVFRFMIHKTPDTDRCINTDRQRNEIKTYDKSPDNLKAVEGEKVEYKWCFKLDAGFRPSSSFTHLHQLKAVGGSEASMPLITLTARKGSPDNLELRYAENLTQETLTKVDLTDFKGNWVEVTETVLFGEAEQGTYHVKIVRLSDSKVLLDFSQNSIRMWKTDADFIRPKWGIYRSLNNASDLRDEELFFNYFQITELITKSLSVSTFPSEKIIFGPNPFVDSLQIDATEIQDIKNLSVYDAEGKLVRQEVVLSSTINLSQLENGVYYIRVQFRDGRSLTRKMLKH